MSSFDMNDELIFKAKYLKYKNKYINLKIEQEGGLLLDKNTSIIFYERSILPKMEELKKKFKDAEDSTTDSYEYIDEKGKPQKIKIEKFLTTGVSIGLSDVNGLGNIFEYKIGSKEILPKLLLNLKLQNLLLSDIDKSHQITLEELGFKEKNFKNLSKLISDLIIKYNKTTIGLGAAYTNIIPITTDNIKAKADVLIGLINNNASNDRTNIFSEIKKKFIDPFGFAINTKLLPPAIFKGYSGENQVKFDNVDSFVIVKNFKVSDEKGLSFQIISVGSDISDGPNPSDFSKVSKVSKVSNVSNVPNVSNGSSGDSIQQENIDQDEGI